MARLHEYQGKELLKQHKISTPHGRLANSIDEVEEILTEIGFPAVLKAQVWSTKRAKMGGIQFADTLESALESAEKLFKLKVSHFQVDSVLVEEKLDILSEYYCGLIIDDSKKQPVMIFSSVGGSGIEEIAQEHPDKVSSIGIDPAEGFRNHHARNLVRKTGISGKLQSQLADILTKLYIVAKKYEARSAEINPIVLTKDNRLMAVDCRITVDDYAVFRHPELGIEIAREFDRPPSKLDHIAYDVEKNDYRGTFYFIQLEREFEKSQRYIGFHGAGGGGSMMSMDAVLKCGFKIANFTDTSGNPPASKVYRAAKIILAQKNIIGYFGSGSGVASQEQFHSARGLVKAFREENLAIPTVIRLGGNQEDLAVEILENYTQDLPAPVEGYKKDDSADFCAERLKTLVDEFDYSKDSRKKSTVKRDFSEPYRFETLTGEITYDHALCMNCDSKACITACGPQILKLENNKPVLAITTEEAKKGKCTECLACEIECEFHGNKGAYISLPIKGLDGA